MEALIRNHAWSTRAAAPFPAPRPAPSTRTNKRWPTSQSWRSGADAQVASALQQAPGFVMAHVLQAYLLLCNRDPQRVRSARPVHARAAALPANERERMHLAAIGAALGDDYEHAKPLLGELLRLYPRDALALQVAHMFDYVTGDTARLHQRVAAVLPAWSPALPGYHAVLAMHAFGLEESGQYELAEETAGAALELDPADARAHHVMAHVFEMTDRPAAGVRWMGRHIATLGRGDRRRHALLVAPRPVPPGAGPARRRAGDLRPAHPRQPQHRDRRPDRCVGAAVARAADGRRRRRALGRAGRRLGAAHRRRILQLQRPARDAGLRRRARLGARAALERTLAARQSLATRHGATTREIGLPACRALIAFGRGDDALALTLLASLPAIAHRFGGSHAQRDVLHLTMQAAIERLRRPRRIVPARGIIYVPRRHDGGTGAPCAASHRRIAPAWRALSLAGARAPGGRGHALPHPD